MAGFAIIGLDKDPLFRFTSMVSAADYFGWHLPRYGVIKDPVLIGKSLVAMRVEDFGAVFRPDEIARLAKTCKRVDSMPKKMRRIMDQLTRCADDARLSSDAANRMMI